MTVLTQPSRNPLAALFTGAPQRAELSRGRTIYITFVLGLVGLLTAVDSNMLSILLVPIQKSIGASNAEMGALSGLAYSFVFAVIALPIGRLADTANRRNIMALSAVVWSVGTTLCGVAGNYTGLLLARMGVACGTASQGPVSSSLIGDLFSPARRGTGIAAITIGGLIGLSAGAALAGLLADRFGWHIAFLLLGTPGLLVAALVWLTVPEPVRGAKDGGAHDPFRGSTWASVKQIFSVRSVSLLMIAQCFLAAAQVSWLTWLPTLFLRVHHLTTTQMAAIYGLVVGLGALFSIIIGGVLGDWLSRHGARWRLYYVVASCLVSAPFAAWGVLANDMRIVVAVIFIYSLIAGGVTPASGAAGLGVVRPTQRALMAAILSFVVLALGGGVGPVVIGAVTDHLQHQYGLMAIRYAMLISPALVAVAGLAFLVASRFIDHDTAMVLAAPAKEAAAAAG